MPPVARVEEALRHQKEARQKKLLVVLAPILLVLLAWQGPGIVSAFTGGDAPPAPSTTDATTPAPAAPVAAPTPPAGEGEAPPATASIPLPESDDPPEAESGELVLFDRFDSKDPFRQQIVARPDSGGASGETGATGGDPAGDSTSDGGSASTGHPAGADVGGGEPTPTVTPTDTDPDGGSGDGPAGGSATVATLDVNGTSEDVSVDGTFPASDPIFRLVALTAKSAKIGLVSGEFSTGAAAITVRRGKSLTLISEPDGMRYTITLVRVS